MSRVKILGVIPARFASTRFPGKPLALIESTLERDHFMSAEEAVEFGIVDEVVRRRPRAPAPAA